VNEPTGTTTTTALRASWRDFPAEYVEALRSTAVTGSGQVQLGPMSWSDARFAQREFYRLIAVLRQEAKTGDSAAVELDQLARGLRVSCPRCEHDLTQHWFVLKANPIVQAVSQAR
jgi:hypothetical protein